MKAFQSFNKHFRKKNLIFTYQNKIAESGAIGIDKVDHFNFSQNLTENIEIIKRKVENDSYKFTVYKQKLFSKEYKHNYMLYLLYCFMGKCLSLCKTWIRII